MELRKLLITSITPMPNEVIKLTMAAVDGLPFDYQAGQFLTIVFERSGKFLRRSYSLSSSPICQEALSIAVKQVENGEISRFIHHQLHEGDVIQVTEANGQFIYHPQKELRRTVFLFAAGVGITPLLSILKTALVAELYSKVVLIYSNRTAEDVLFAEEIDLWAKKYDQRLKVVYLNSNSKNLMRARLNGFLINELVKQELIYDSESALFYTCGPVDYMDVCKITLLSSGYTAQQIKRETFVLPEDEVDEDDTTEKVVDKSTYAVKLIFRGSTYELSIPYPKRILEVALKAGLDLPYSCSGGVCSTCVASCIAGGVKMDYNEVLTDAEINAGRVLVCTGRPVSNDTVITWDY